MKKTIIATAIAAAVSTPVLAQSNDSNSDLLPSLETIVVVSSRQDTPLREVATSVAVMDEAQIKARGFTALADVLRTMPSVSVTNSGGMGKASSIRVRGEAGFRTLVRVDGVDVTDPTGTQASSQIQHVLSTNVGKVELLRGPQGMMYGADAGGVLNITTRGVDQGTQVDLSAEGGSFGSQRYNASVGGANDSVDYYVSAAYAETDGFNTSLNDTELQDDDGYENTTLHGRIGWNISDSLRLEAVARDTDATNEFDRCGYPYIDACVGEFDQTNTRVSIAHSVAGFDNQLAYSNTDITRKNFADGVNSYDTEGDIQKLEWIGRAALSDTHTVAYGLEQRQDTVRDMSRDQWGAYAEYQGNYADRFYLTAGVRRDDNDDFGEYDSYRVSAAYVIDALSSGTVKLKTSYGTGFRAPSLFEIDYNHSQNNPTLLPLEPEESEGFDVGIEYFGHSGLHLEAVVFDQTIDREIGFDLVGYTGYIQGSGESQSEGVELIVDAPLGDSLVLNANYTYTDASDNDDSPRARQPKNMLNLGLTYLPTDALTVSFNARAADGTVDNGDVQLADYEVLDASVRYRLNSALTFYVRAENLTDEDYVEVSGYRTAGASGYAGVEVTF
ncbi:TonB-dependent receptor plug domain-containing protein [Gilvimarinus polysaccharolyticus]|uniref:TonB-dependent receptor plug domain-containing protein n=1 Tax=Gilvimarinus polysaccharolyticus TaxID=863921 RepID=UPI000673C4CF|nr:TonB-dependent receptor [Gilvimarinus polysaccharolyticus]